MVEIQFPNGAKYQLTGLVLNGKYIDSDGSFSVGNTNIPYTEADINKLNEVAPLQQIFGAFSSAESNGAQEAAQAQEQA